MFTTPYRSSSLIARTTSRTLIALAVGFACTADAPAVLAQTKATIADRVLATRHRAGLPASRVDDLLLTVKEEFAELEAMIDPADVDGAPIDYIGAARGVSPIVRADAAGRLRVYVHVRDTAIVDALAAAGLVVELANADMRIVQGWAPADRLEAIAAVAGVVRVRPVTAPVARRGVVTSEGVALAAADALHRLGVDGTGIRVGVISDGIAGLVKSQTSGDLPVVYAESGRTDGNVEGGFGGDGSPGAEGTAILEIIHDLAPGAELYFSNPDTRLGLVRAMHILADEFDCDIVIDDVGLLDEPFFEDGVIAIEAQRIVESGKVYVSSAGNSGVGHYQGTFAVGERIDGWDLHDFGGGDTDINIHLDPGEWFSVVLQWNTPYDGAAVDLDLTLLDETGAVVQRSFGSQGCAADEAAGIALEYVGLENDGDTARDYRLRVMRYCPDDAFPEIELYFNGWPVQVDHNVAADSVFGHPAAPGVIACGAVDANSAGLDQPEYFSSRGPGTVYSGGTDAHGLLTRPDYRPKPDMCGVDGVAVTGNGGFPSKFYGTSASAPHVAACAALLWSAYPQLDSDEVRATLLATARDIATPGFDLDTGYGMMDAFAAVVSRNDAPVARDDAAATDSATPVVITVAANDVDSNGDALTVTAVSQPARGAVTISTDGAGVVFTPDDVFVGPMEFTYTVADRFGASADARVVVTVGPAYLTLDDDPAAAPCGAGAALLAVPVLGVFGLVTRRRARRTEPRP